MEWAIRIMAVSLSIIAMSAAGYAGLRIADEFRFRRAISEIEEQKRSGKPIVLPTRTHGKTGRGDSRRRRAAEFINDRTK